MALPAHCVSQSELPECCPGLVGALGWGLRGPRPEQCKGSLWGVAERDVGWALGRCHVW